MCLQSVGSYVFIGGSGLFLDLLDGLLNGESLDIQKKDIDIYI